MARRGDNIRKRKDGRWEGRVKVNTIEGKTIYKSLYALSYREVKLKMSDFSKSEEHKQDCIVNDTNKTVEDVFTEWINNLQKIRKESTCTKYRNIYKVHIKPYIGEKLISKLKESDYSGIIISEYSKGNKCGKNLSKSTINSIKYVLLQILASSEISFPTDCLMNDCHSIKDVKNSISVFDDNEQQKLFDFLTTDIDGYKLGLLICLLTGMRLGEVCALSIDDVDMKNSLIYVRHTVERVENIEGTSKTKLICTPPKSDSSIRKIPICDTLYPYLIKYTLKDRKYIVCNNKWADPRTYEYRFLRYLNKLNIPARKFHTVRHTFATNCLSNGMDVKCLSEILGHSDVQITLNKYVHPTMEMKRNSINQCTVKYGRKNGQTFQNQKQ